MKWLIPLVLLLPACTRDSWPAKESNRCDSTAWPCPTVINGEAYMICRPKDERCESIPPTIQIPATVSGP